MRNLKSEEFGLWYERFWSFYDSVVRSWAADFAQATKILVLTIEAQDRESPSGWSLLTLRLSGVSSVRLSEGPKASYLVLSNGLHALFAVGCVGLEFGDFDDAPKTILELMQSPFHVVAESLDWDARFILNVGRGISD